MLLPNTLVPVTRRDKTEWVCAKCAAEIAEETEWVDLIGLMVFLFALVSLPVLAVWVLVRDFDPILDFLSVLVLYWVVKCLIASIIGLYREWRRRLLWRLTRDSGPRASRC